MLRITCVGLALSIMVGCAATTFNDVMEASYADFQGGGDISSVMVVPTSSGDQVFSGIRSWGHDPVVLGESDTFDLLNRETEWGRLRIIGPGRNRSELEAGLAEIPSETIERMINLVSTVVGTRLQAMKELQERRIALSFFASGDWWLRNTSVAAHELTHLNHRLLGNPIPRDDHAAETNVETAAMMVAYCAQYQFVERAAEPDERPQVTD